MKKLTTFFITIFPFLGFSEINPNDFKGNNYETFNTIYERYKDYYNLAWKIRNKVGKIESQDYELYAYYLGKLHAYDECLDSLFPGIWITNNVIYDMSDFIED